MQNTRRLRTLDVCISPLSSRVLFCSLIIARLCSFDHFISWIKHETNWRTWGFAVLGPFSEFRRSLSKTPNREFVKRGKTVFSNIQFIKIPIKTTEQGHTSGEGKMHVLLTYEYKLNWCENGKYHAISWPARSTWFPPKHRCALAWRCYFLIVAILGAKRVSE